MKNDNLHLIPQAILDCAEGLSKTKQDNLKLNYIIRLEAIRNFCDEAIRKHNMETNTNIWKRGRGSRNIEVVK